MSIAAAARRLVLNGHLVDRPSSFTGARARRMFVTLEIDGHAQRPFPETFDGNRFAELASFLDAFCELNEITVSEDPDKKPWDVMLARVHPVNEDFWSMRIVDPPNTPGLRLLGGFCAKDEFVALKWEFRESIYDFDGEVNELKEAWRDHFGDLQPLSGSTVNEYLSNFDLQ